MSYCTCFACGQMVSMYEKYCPLCLEKYNLKQGDWREFKPKTQYGSPERYAEVTAEIERDKLEVKQIPDTRPEKIRKERKKRKQRVAKLRKRKRAVHSLR